MTRLLILALVGLALAPATAAAKEGHEELAFSV